MFLTVSLYPNINSLLDRLLCEGFSALQTSRFYSCPSDRDNFKILLRLDVWTLFGVLFRKFMVYFGEEISVFLLFCVNFFSHGNLSLFLRILNW